MEQEQKKKKEFGKNTKVLFKKMYSYFGGLVTVVAAILYVFADKVFDTTGVMYRQAIYIVIVGYGLVFVAALIVNVIFLIGFDRQEIYEKVINDLRENSKSIDISTNNINQTNKELSTSLAILTQDIKKVRSTATEIEIGQYVLNGRGVKNLEESVGNYDGPNGKCKIYIQSSLFVLEKGPLEETILWNLRKGVKYIYIIPKGEAYINDYYDMLRDWYGLFSQFLISKEIYAKLQENLDSQSKYKEYWSQEYQQIYDEVGKLWNETSLSQKTKKEKVNAYREKCEKLFSSLIETHVDDENEFFITVAAYEVKRREWEAIIKLPTQNTNKEYYAFQIPNDNNMEMTSFFLKFKSRYKSNNYDPKNMSTLGGKLQLDLSRIFN